MSAPQFTPGPWGYLPTDEQTHAVVSPLDDTDGQWFTAIVSCADDAVEDANARLIAAAPELYEALLGYVEHIEPYLMKAVEAGYNNSPHVKLMDAAKAALAKARGEQA